MSPANPEWGRCRVCAHEALIVVKRTQECRPCAVKRRRRERDARRLEVDGRRNDRGNPQFLKAKTCPTCGTSFEPAVGAQKYCTRECHHVAMEVERTCPQCEQVFTCQRHDRKRHCSTLCANRSTAHLRRGKKGKFGWGVSQAKFPQVAVCEGCKQKFMKKSKNVQFCSRACHMKDRHARRREVAPPKWSIKTKGEDMCRNCGQTAINLHHIVPKSKARAGHTEIGANGLPLCFRCHRGWHDRTATIHHEVLTDAEFRFAVLHAGGLWVELNYPDRPEVALQQFDEVLRGRVLFPDRTESFSERMRRVLPESEVAA